MKRTFCLLLGVSLVVLLAQAAQQGKQDEKATTTRTLKVKLNYTGSGTVDEKHKIIVFLFDSPDFVQGSVMPFTMKTASAKDEMVVITDIGSSPVYAVAAFDPSGAYDGQSGPPPSGSSMGMYSKTPGKPEPIEIGAGKTVEIDLPFDDSFKMP